jgi:hypothetical protein
MRLVDDHFEMKKIAVGSGLAIELGVGRPATLIVGRPFG